MKQTPSINDRILKIFLWMSDNVWALFLVTGGIALFFNTHTPILKVIAGILLVLGSIILIWGKKLTDKFIEYTLKAASDTADQQSGDDKLK